MYIKQIIHTDETMSYSKLLLIVTSVLLKSLAIGEITNQLDSWSLQVENDFWRLSDLICAIGCQGESLLR